MKVKSAYKPPARISWYSITTLFVFSVAVLLLFLFNYLFLGLVASAIGLAAFIYAIVMDHRAQGITAKDYAARIQLRFKCPQCGNAI